MRTPQKKASVAETASTQKSAARKTVAPKSSAARAPFDVNLQIVTLAGNIVAEVTVHQSSSVQLLLDEAKAAIVESQCKDDERILHLQYGDQVLAHHWLLGDGGVDDGAILTLIFEGALLKLRIVDRRLSHMQATTAVSRLESKLVEHDAAVAIAQELMQKAAADVAAINEQPAKLQKGVGAACAGQRRRSSPSGDGKKIEGAREASACEVGPAYGLRSHPQMFDF